MNPVWDGSVDDPYANDWLLSPSVQKSASYSKLCLKFTDNYQELTYTDRYVNPDDTVEPDLEGNKIGVKYQGKNGGELKKAFVHIAYLKPTIPPLSRKAPGMVIRGDHIGKLYQSVWGAKKGCIKIKIPGETSTWTMPLNHVCRIEK